MEEFLLNLLKEYGYIILFLWSILEGELGLIMAGMLCFAGSMNIALAIFVAGLGGFTGDQIYFYIGRYSKNYIHKKFSKYRRKFAISHLLLQKYGWFLIFIQRYMYGLRTIIPISIGLTRYSAKKFAIINLFSAWIWAAITILLAYYFAQELIDMLHFAKKHWYYALPFASLILYIANKAINKFEKRLEQKRKAKI